MAKKPINSVIIPINKSSHIMVEKSVYGVRETITIREWKETPGYQRPTKNGIEVSFEFAKEIYDALRQILGK